MSCDNNTMKSLQYPVGRICTDEKCDSHPRIQTLRDPAPAPGPFKYSPDLSAYSPSSEAIQGLPALSSSSSLPSTVPVLIRESGVYVESTSRWFSPPELRRHETEAVLPSQDEYSEHPSFRELLEDIVLVTRCHGCGRKKNVCFSGYVGRFCSKRCWKKYESAYESGGEEEDVRDHPVTCKWCYTNKCASYAVSTYHRDYHNSRSSTGYVWPMRSRSSCDNECIKSRQTIRIKGYNS